MNEIMVIKEGRLRLFQVDDDTIAKLTRIRGNFYQDNPRLTLVKDLPEHKKPIADGFVVTTEQMARAEAALNLHKMIQAAGERTTTTPVMPVKQPESPLTPEEEWRTRPDIRAEFISLTSYAAYCRAVRDGRTKVYGCKS